MKEIKKSQPASQGVDISNNSTRCNHAGRGKDALQPV